MVPFDWSELALSVPPVVVPRERNVIINPGHRDFNRLTIAAAEPFSFDLRMWKTR
jgi:RES domain-containing protein